MAALWRIGSGSVEQVRHELPPQYHGAYTTVQTALARLAERGLLTRERVGRVFVYRPRFSEAEYLADSIRRTLAGASSDARRAAIAIVIGRLDPGEVLALRRAAKRTRAVGVVKSA